MYMKLFVDHIEYVIDGITVIILDVRYNTYLSRSHER